MGSSLVKNKGTQQPLAISVLQRLGLSVLKA